LSIYNIPSVNKTNNKHRVTTDILIAKDYIIFARSIDFLLTSIFMDIAKIIPPKNNIIDNM
jgi:hypothetical protein